MRLLIPTTGTHLRLEADWKFDLFREQRNDPLRKKLKMKAQGWQGNPDKADSVTLPKGTVLTVDRIYLRLGAEAFDSVTFRVHSSPKKAITKARFWAKLADVNRIECTADPATTPGYEGPSILGLDQSPRFGHQAKYAVGDRVYFRGLLKAGVGVIVSSWAKGWYTVALPSHVQKVAPVRSKVHAVTVDSNKDPGFVVYGGQGRHHDLRLAIDTEIAKDAGRLGKLTNRREKAAQNDLEYLKRLYENPLMGHELTVVLERYDCRLETRTVEAFGHPNGYEHQVDVTAEAFYTLQQDARRDSVGTKTDILEIAVAQWPGIRGRWHSDPRVARCEHTVVAAVQQGYLDPEAAKAVLPDRVIKQVGAEALIPRWDAGVPILLCVGDG